MKEPEISILIRTFNEEKYLEECLKKVFKQSLKDLEVIIIDSGSKDNTLKIAKKFPVRIVLIDKKDFSYGRSLNLGCKNSKGKYLVSLSAHAIPKNKKWLEELIKPLKNKEIAGVYGKQVAYNNASPRIKRKFNIYYGKKKIIQKNNPKFSNSNSAFKKDLWRKEKFDENLIASEDTDWAKKIQKNGYWIFYNPKAEVFHSHEDKLKQLFKRNFNDTYTIILIKRDNSRILHFFKGPIYFLLDLEYIIKNNYHPKFILKSFIENLTIFVSSAKCFLNILKR
ncbi:MAG: glycosyltransferase [Candidatus Nanoarchaeia archaeon]